jgi:hypothetical protein
MVSLSKQNQPVEPLLPGLIDQNLAHVLCVQEQDITLPGFLERSRHPLDRSILKFSP